MRPIRLASGETLPPSSYARVAGVAFEAIDGVLGALGRPLGLQSYRPFHATGEDFLESYLGTAGVPIELVPRFPESEPVVLLTAHAAKDPGIVDAIERKLRAGGKVVITSGLLKALAPRGIARIAEVEDTGRVALVKTFQAGRRPPVEGDKAILIPQIGYRTNDSWELVSALDGDNGWPLLHDADYGTGHLYVLTVPENFADFYHYPQPALDAIRRLLTPHLPVQLEAPAKVSLFVYDNGTFVVQSFRDEPVEVTVTLELAREAVVDVSSGETLATSERRQSPGFGKPPVPVKRTATFRLPPHSFRAFRAR
jgi:hypothetical protein